MKKEIEKKISPSLLRRRQVKYLFSILFDEIPSIFNHFRGISNTSCTNSPFQLYILAISSLSLSPFRFPIFGSLIWFDRILVLSIGFFLWYTFHSSKSRSRLMSSKFFSSSKHFISMQLIPLLKKSPSLNFYTTNRANTLFYFKLRYNYVKHCGNKRDEFLFSQLNVRW